MGKKQSRRAGTGRYTVSIPSWVHAKVCVFIVLSSTIYYICDGNGMRKKHFGLSNTIMVALQEKYIKQMSYCIVTCTGKPNTAKYIVKIKKNIVCDMIHFCHIAQPYCHGYKHQLKLFISFFLLVQFKRSWDGSFEIHGKP